MNQEQILQLIVHVLHAMGASSKSTAIAEYAMSPSFTRHAIGHSFDLHAFSDVHALSSKITSTISSHKRDSSPRSCMIEGSKSGGWRLTAAAGQMLGLTHQDLQRPADTQFTGLAGEYAVMSELLACDWNVAKLPHDDGVDLVATRGALLRTVQVKTAHAFSGHTYTFSVNRRAHDQHTAIHHYYVLVIRSIQGQRHINDFLVLSSHAILDLQVSGAVRATGEKNWQIVVKAEGGKVHIGNKDCTDKLNRFRALFI
jgi:hypothetical protein